jgi:hypothetical protein
MEKLKISSEHKIRSENLPFDIDVWYPILKDFTFKTHFIPLSISEAKAIIIFYRTKYNIQRNRDLNGDDIIILNSLENRIQNNLQNNFKNGAFIRLCGRSPKDGEPLHPNKVINHYTQELKRIKQDETLENFPEAGKKMMAIGKTNNIMKVNNGSEAMNLLLTSERVCADMIDWIEHGEPEQIVLREWEPELSLDFEFRVYVNKNKLNAISQYDHYGVNNIIFK